MIVFRILFVALLLLSLTGCGGSDTEVKTTTTTTTTMGQELIDLDESYKRGIISESEYKNAKEKIMKRYGN